MFAILIMLALFASITPVFAQAQVCTVVQSRVITTEQSETTSSTGVTIQEVLSAMGATQGQLLRLTSQATMADANGMAPWLTAPQVGMTQTGMTFRGVYNTTQYIGQTWTGVNGGNGLNPVLVQLCQEREDSQIPIVTATPQPALPMSTAIPTIAAPFGIMDSMPWTWQSTDSWAWPSLLNGARHWCDGYVTPLDGTLEQANSFAGNLVLKPEVESALVVLDQLSTRTGSQGITLREAYNQLGAEDGDLILLFPFNGQGVCLDWWLANIQVSDGAFAFWYNADSATVDRDFPWFTEVNGGDSSNPVVLALVKTYNLDQIVEGLLR